MDAPAYLLTCDVCRRQDCEPKTMAVWPVWRRLEENRRSEPPIEEGQEMIPYKGGDLTREAVEWMNEFELAARDLTPEDREELLETGRIVIGGTIICPVCVSRSRERRNKKSGRPEQGSS